MKIKGRAYVPSGRQYEMLEMVYESESEGMQDDIRTDWIERERVRIKQLITEDARELFLSLKGVKEINDGDYFLLNGVMWRNLDGKWEYKEGETWISK